MGMLYERANEKLKLTQGLSNNIQSLRRTVKQSSLPLDQKSKSRKFVLRNNAGNKRTVISTHRPMDSCFQTVDLDRFYPKLAINNQYTSVWATLLQQTSFALYETVITADINQYE